MVERITRKGLGAVPAIGLAVALATVLTVACTPTVKVEAPREPITINLNIKLDADVRLKLEKDAETDIKKNPEIF